MSGLKGNVNDLKKLRKRLLGFSVEVVQNVARQAAPALTTLAQSAYNSGNNVYGDARPDGKNGPLDLRVTGATERTLRFTNAGTVVRCVLGTRYAKYLIGKYRILPMGRMPSRWANRLSEIVQQQKF